jgi:ABC-2 type transport system ATP-binding protein
MNTIAESVDLQTATQSVPAPMALAFSGVSKRFRNGKLALDDVSWSIAAGSRVCLLGPNGAGKSTAIRLLEGAITPTTGSVRLLGASVSGGDYLDARRRTGIVPQNPGMYADLTTLEYLQLIRRLYGKGDVDNVVEALGLTEHRATRMAQLSGGYQRRVVLAAALLCEPDLLLLDEPTVGLDPVAASDVHTLLQSAMRGRTTLLCTHNLAEAEALCDEVVILRRGKVLVHAPLADLRRQTQPQLQLAVRQGAATLGAALRERGLKPSVANGDIAIIPRPDGNDGIAALVRSLISDGLDVYESHSIDASLEDMFLDLVRG